MKSTRLTIHVLLLTFVLSLVLTSTALAEPVAPSASRSVTVPMDAEATDRAADDNPLVCIDTWTGVHLAATALATGLGFSPFKVAAIAADGTAHWAGVELKHCRPFLEAPRDLVIEPAACTATIEIPIPRSALEQLALDNQIVELILTDPTVNLPIAFRQALQAGLDKEYGYLSNETSGSYSNIYFIVNPIFSSAVSASNWGDLGAPEIYHFNSDVEVVMRHTGNRIDMNRVAFPAGTHTATWIADTLIEGADLVWIPDLSGIGAAKKKAQKEAVKKTWKETIKGWFKAARDAAKDVYTDIAKNQAKKTKKKLQEYGKKKLREKAATDAIGFVLDSYFLAGYKHGRTTIKFQRIYVLDKNAPTISGNTPVTVEALEPGGVSSGNHINALKQRLNITDDCDPSPELTYNTPAFWPLSRQADGSTIPSEITWTASDNGAAGPTGGVNQTVATQQVTVADTKPPILVAPPPVIMEAAAGQLMSVPLGMAQVFDVADLRPTISNDAPAQFGQGVYRINWSATDFSGNVSASTKDTVQIVNLKQPGTNVLPTAFDQTGANAVSATAYEPIKITVRGQDGDPTPDPLWFSIENQPANGFFIAPLYPYFIDDYRMTARYSPQIAAAEGEAFAWELAADPQKMRQYMKDLCAVDLSRRDLPRDFVSWRGGSERYMAVDDDGFTYVADTYTDKCTPGGSTIAPTTQERVSVWDPNGVYVGGIDQSNSGPPLQDINFDLVRGRIIQTTSHGDTTGDGNVTVIRINKANPQAPTLEQEVSYRMNAHIEDPASGRDVQFRNATSAVIDSNGVFYIISSPNIQGMIAAYPSATDPIVLDYLGAMVYSLSVRQSIGDESGIRLSNVYDVALDSHNNVYIAATLKVPLSNGQTVVSDRIYKWSRATIQPDGSVQLGELIGWMGKCDSGPDCDYIHQRSVGYSCTDDTCFIDAGQQGTGDRPGQFDFTGNTAIAIDPNDILYVTDGRVQRFSPEGYVAGEARSSGDGSSFVLGDFGAPDYIAVNKGSFYILDRQREIVHVFDAAVIHGIDERSAWVEYQSDNNFVGTDRFTFAATDGFRNGDGETLYSPPATVEINVSRNFRPPEATAGMSIRVTEDTPANLVLEGYDIDGALDTLTFQVTAPPADGTLSGTPPNLTYTPRANFDDVDGFYFTVSDGRFTADPEEFVITMLPVNDPPVLALENQTFRAGAGFPFSFQGTAVDPEIDDDLTVKVDWGDGAVQGEGAAQTNGTLSGPVINASGVPTRTILAYHTYGSPGAYNLTVTVTDPSGASDVITQQVTVEAMADLALQRKGATSASPTRLTLSYELVAVNLPPAGGGITASGVQIRETLGAGLTYRTAATNDGSCQAAGQSLTCTLNPMAVNATSTVRVVVDVNPSLAVGAEVAVQAAVSATTPDPVPENNDSANRIAMLPAADFLVDAPVEGSDMAPGDGLCMTAEGACTLRAALQEANALPGKQSIALPRDTYMLNLDNATVVAAFAGAAATPTEDAAASGDLDITDALDIIGLGADTTVLDANGQDRVIDVLNGATVTIRGVALTGGMPADVGSSYGGGLRNVNGIVTLSYVNINANESLGGGGIANMGGSMRVIASAITGNNAGAGSGGGLLNQADLTLENVSVSGNRAGTGGGIQALGGNAALRNVTLFGNVAANAGGGINNGDGNALRLANTIVAGNSAAFGPVCGYTFSSDGHNLFDNLADCTVLGETGSNIVDDAFNLQNMSINAANTYAHLPIAGSRLIDAGRCDLAADQRGVTRPQGNGCDIGAIEFVTGDDSPVGPTTSTFTLFLPLAYR